MGIHVMYNNKDTSSFAVGKKCHTMKIDKKDLNDNW